MYNQRKSSDRSERSGRAEKFDKAERTGERERRQVKFQVPKGTVIDYKQVNFLQKYVTDRGKIISRRITGISSKEQRAITREVQKARFLGLISIGLRNRT